jgi:hypothetical protein
MHFLFLSINVSKALASKSMLPIMRASAKEQLPKRAIPKQQASFGSAIFKPKLKLKNLLN